MISIIMPVYNASQFLRKSIESILNQTEQDFELIIINDGSTDASEHIIQSYSDPRIVYIQQPNSGIAATRNKGLDTAKGDLIAWQDSDDISLPCRLERLKNSFTSDLIGFAHSDMMLVNESDVPIGYWQSHNVEPCDMLRFFLKKGTPFNNGTMMFRHELFKDFQHDTSLKVGSDSDMVFRVTLGWRSVHVPEPLYIYRRHSNNITRQSDYSISVAYVRKFLSRHTLEELVPELDWRDADLHDNQAKAYAIVGLMLSRRGLRPDALEWLEKAKNAECGIESRLFVRAIALLESSSYELAQQIFLSYSTQDYVTKNYLGEIAAFLGDTEQAYLYFVKALEQNPRYIDPIDNIRGLGGQQSLQLIDSSWLKFKKAS